MSVLTAAAVLGIGAGAPRAEAVATRSAPDVGAKSAALRLPVPTGPRPTGTHLIHLRDRDRIDLLDPKRSKRELMVQVWYPARHGGQGALAHYAPRREAALLERTYGTPPGGFERRTNSRLSTSVAPGRHPVVFFNHGLCASRTDSTIVAEDLASHGYVVVAIGTTRESVGVQFPGGRVVTTSDPAFCQAGADPWGAGKPVLERLLRVRVADSRFVMDELTRMRAGSNPDVDRLPLPSGLGRSLDLSKVGIYGHSFGGGQAAQVLLEDKRFDAGVDLDGFVHGSVVRRGLAKPFLAVGSSYHTPQYDPSWAQFLPRLRGWHRWFQVTDAGHYRFMDVGGSAYWWNLDKTLGGSDPQTWRLIFGDIKDRESQRINRRLVLGVMDRFLKGEPAPVLDNPRATFPSVRDRTSQIP